LNYEALVKVDISVSDDDYRSLVIKFFSPELSSFVAQFSVGRKALMMTNGSSLVSATGDGKSWSAHRASDTEALMRMAVDEWDRCKAENESASKGMAMDTNTDPVTVLAEERGRVVGSLKNARNPFVGIAGVKSTTVVPVPVRIWPLVTKNVLWERVDQILTRAKGTHLAVPVLALATRGRGQDRGIEGERCSVGRRFGRRWRDICISYWGCD
jgi:hypothetical protein